MIEIFVSIWMEQINGDEDFWGALVMQGNLLIQTLNYVSYVHEEQWDNNIVEKVFIGNFPLCCFPLHGKSLCRQLKTFQKRKYCFWYWESANGSSS